MLGASFGISSPPSSVPCSSAEINEQNVVSNHPIFVKIMMPEIGCMSLKALA